MVGATTASCGFRPFVPVGGRPIAGTETYPRHVRPRCRSNDLATDTPCHAPRLPSSRRLDPKRQGPFPHTAHQPPWLSRPGATSTDESLLPHPLLARRVRLRGRHCCLGFAASAQLPITRSPASQQARSNRRAGYSPERLGHVSSIDFCNCMNSQARPRLPKPRRVFAVASHRTVGDVVLARRHLLSLHSPGVARPTEETCNDRRVVRYAATALPQPVLPHTPHVAHQHRRCLEQATEATIRIPTPAGAELGPSQPPACLHTGRLEREN